MEATGACPWERHWDEDESAFYFFNEAAGTSEWDVPKGWEAHFAELDAKLAAAAAAATAAGAVAGVASTAAADVAAASAAAPAASSTDYSTATGASREDASEEELQVDVGQEDDYPPAREEQRGDEAVVAHGNAADRQEGSSGQRSRGGEHTRGYQTQALLGEATTEEQDNQEDRELNSVQGSALEPGYAPANAATTAPAGLGEARQGDQQNEDGRAVSSAAFLRNEDYQEKYEEQERQTGRREGDEELEHLGPLSPSSGDAVSNSGGGGGGGGSGGSGSAPATNDESRSGGGDDHDDNADSETSAPTGGDSGPADGSTAAAAATAAATSTAGASCPWIQTEDEESGNVFYYNETTQESSWEEPPEYTRFHSALNRLSGTGDDIGTVDGIGGGIGNRIGDGSGSGSGTPGSNSNDSAATSAASDDDDDEDDGNDNDDDLESGKHSPGEGIDLEPASPPADARYFSGTPSPPSSPEQDQAGYGEEENEERHGKGVRSAAVSPARDYQAVGGAGDAPLRPRRKSARAAAAAQERSRSVAAAAAAAGTTRSSASRRRGSASPDFGEGGRGGGGGGGIASPSFGEDISPKNDWHVEADEGSPVGSPSFGSSLSPEDGEGGSRGGAGAGFAVGELSPIVDNGGAPEQDGHGVALGKAGEGVGRGMGAGAGGGVGAAAGLVAGKENDVGVVEGGRHVSEAVKQQRIVTAEKDVAAMELRLEEKDAIMEVDFHARVTEYQSALRRLRLLKGEASNNRESLNQSVKKLIAGYHGYAQQVALVNHWLQLATNGQQDTESLMLQQLTKLIKKNFDAKKADALLDSGSGVPSWLTAMQGHDGWRRTLIELAREHRGSALLRFVLKQLSDRGHHREIAAVINETDLFSVFNGVLKDALARVPADDEVEVTEALADLKRMCCSTSYMFMYSQQLLIDLEIAAAAPDATGGDSVSAAELDNAARRSGSRKRGRENTDETQLQPEEERSAKKTRVGNGDENGKSSAKVAGDKETEGSWEGGRRGRMAAARKYKRLRQELAKHMYEAGGTTALDYTTSLPSLSSTGGSGGGGSSNNLGRSNSSSTGGGGGGSGGGSGGGGGGGGGRTGGSGAGAGAAPGRPSGGFVRGVELSLSLGMESLHPSTNPLQSQSATPSPRLLPPPQQQDAAGMIATARAASDAVVSILGLAGGGGGGGGVSGSGGGGGRAGGGGGAARRTALSEAVETLVSAFGLREATRAAVQGAAAAVGQGSISGEVRPPASLLRHPTVMDILLETLFHPAHRSSSEDLRAGCCAILAYASCVEVPTLGGGGSDSKSKEAVDFVEVAETSHAIMQAGEECFDMRPSQLASLQGRLRPYAEHPLVSLGALKWIHAQVSKEAFCSTPSFLSYAPMFLKLCGQTADEHPPQRPDAFEILKVMLSARTAADTPAASKTKLKQQVLLRMADLMVKGYVLPVLDYLRKLAAGPGLDQPLVAFFIIKIVGVAITRGGEAKTYSPAFLNAMADLMGVPRVRQALQGKQLSPKDRERLNSYARYCLKFQSKDLTVESLESMKQLMIGLERA